MNITKSADQIVNSLIDTQKKIWDTISESINAVSGAPADKRWEEGVGASETLVKNSLKAQADLTHTLVKTVKDIEGLPDRAIDTLEEFDKIQKELSKSQQGLAGNAFDMLKTLDPSRVAASYTDAFRGAVERIQSMTQKAMETQMEMIRSMTGQTATKKTAKKETAKKETVSAK